LLPQKEYKEGVVAESLRNLEYPLNWEGIIEHVGMPCFMKPYDGGGWRGVSKINNLHELWEKYNESGTDVMVLQEYIAFDHYVRCYTIGKKDVWPMPYDPIHQRYIFVPGYLEPAVEERCRRDAIAICQALGYDINTVEFAIKDGVPYAIDYMNPAPDADWWSVGSIYFNWMIQRVADLAIRTALEGESTINDMCWRDFINAGVRFDSAKAAGEKE
jgi:D-alanine-D-alanine ligase-like ATP-grasp enzyme